MPDDDDIPSEEKKGVERIPPKAQMSYIEICLFEETDYILLVNEKNYKVSVSIDPMAKNTPLLNSVIDTDGNPTLIWEDFLQTELLRAVRAHNVPSLRNTTTQ